MRRFISLSAAALLVPAVLAAQNPPVQRASQPGSAAVKIASAMSAAPASVSAQATIMDWPSTPNGQPTQLRAGTNGWVCFPDMPDTQGNDPMCLDGQWQKWAQAWLGHTTPQLTSVGVGYMVTANAEGSNTDPYAMQRTADNEWGADPAHIMVVVPDVHALEGMPTDRNNGGPWVMYRGTPYAHLMIPLDRK
ncbi:MAG TPA: hypothetical protein VF771_15940 [Longimicrobiaceae bacterium]